LNQDSYRNLVSRQSGGLFNWLLLVLLRAVSMLYAIGICVRNLCYDKGWLKTRGVSVPVISIGNITTGGTGKTPLVIWMCKLLHEKGKACAILTRGYKAEQGKLTDEPAILAKLCPDAKIVINSDRFAGAVKATEELGAEVLVMDDGFQHRRLRRNLDILAVDAMCPFGYSRLLPAGLLREPVISIRRADAVVITRFNRVSHEKTEELKKQIECISPGIVVAMAVHKNLEAKLIKGQSLSIDELREKKIFAFCGIGNPKGFLDQLNDYGLTIVGSKVYNDHYQYCEMDVSDIYQEAVFLGADLILSTQKDWVKTALLLQKKEEIPFAYLSVEIEFLEGADKIETLLDKAMASKMF